MPWEGDADEGETDKTEERKNPVGIAHLGSLISFEDIVERSPDQRRDRDGLRPIVPGWRLKRQTIRFPSLFPKYALACCPQTTSVRIGM
jgi:hypothetical protein